MKAGALRHILVFQTKTETSDGMGPGGAESWADTLTARAERWHISGAERVEAARTKQNSMVRWHCRHNPSACPAARSPPSAHPHAKPDPMLISASRPSVGTR